MAVEYAFKMRPGTVLHMFHPMVSPLHQKLVIEGLIDEGSRSVDGFLPDLAECDVEVVVKVTPRFEPGYYRFIGTGRVPTYERPISHYTKAPWIGWGDAAPERQEPDNWERVTVAHAV